MVLASIKKVPYLGGGAQSLLKTSNPSWLVYRSNSGVSDQGSNPSRDTCVLKQDTEPLLRPSDGK